MKKTIFTLALAVVAMLGISASAQTQTATCAKAQCAKQACDKSQNNDNRMRRPASWREFAFEGVLLSVEQQAKIDEINKEFDSKIAPKCDKAEGKCDKAKCDKAEGKCDKAKCDKAEGKCQKGDRKGGHNFQARNEYIAKVKEVLTPEQYTTFLENIVNMPAQRGNKAGQCKKMVKKDIKDAKPACKKDCKKAGKKAEKATK